MKSKFENPWMKKKIEIYFADFGGVKCYGKVFHSLNGFGQQGFDVYDLTHHFRMIFENKCSHRYFQLNSGKQFLECFLLWRWLKKIPSIGK